MKFYSNEIYYDDGWKLEERKFNYVLDKIIIGAFNDPRGGILHSLFPLSEDQKNKFLSFYVNN